MAEYHGQSTGEVYCADGAPKDAIYGRVDVEMKLSAHGVQQADAGVVSRPSPTAMPNPGYKEIHGSVNTERMGNGLSQGGTNGAGSKVGGKTSW